MSPPPVQSRLHEHHLHLEGSLRPATLRQLDPQLTDQRIAEGLHYTDFGGFLRTFVWADSHLRRPEDYALALRALLQELVSQGVTSAHLTLSAGVVLFKALPLGDVFDALIREPSPIPIVWILDWVRQWGPVAAWDVVDFAISRRHQGVVAVGLGGDEGRGPIHWYREHFLAARRAGLAIMPHAGETTGPDTIWQALELDPARIAHGVQAIKDPVLVRHLADRQIPLDICITSNLRTGVYPSIEAHPVRRLFDAGVALTISTDDPALFHTTLTAEYQLLVNHFGFTPAEIAQLRAQR